MRYKVMRYKVFESPISSTVIYSTDSLKELLEYGRENETMADAVTVDGLVAYGWDEIETRILEL